MLRKSGCLWLEEQVVSGARAVGFCNQGMREKATLQAGKDLKGAEGSLLQGKGFVSSSLPARMSWKGRW